VFAAPREVVFRAWTEPEQLSRWLGPTGFVAHSVTGDVTHMTFHQSGYVSVEDRDNHQGGWSSAFDDLAAYLART
jgi:uncharacterized protein YndB with AHSA1/START domain